MTTVLNFGRDVQGNNAYAPMTSTDKWQATLTNGNETHITVPSNFQKWIIAFSYQPGGTVWVDLTGGTAQVPGGATLAPTTSELNPGARVVLSGSKISMITANVTCDVGIVMYAQS